MCKHNWIWAIPDTKELSHDKRLDVIVELIGQSIMKRCVFCTICGRTGHKINSRRSGIRLHNNDEFLKEANKFREKFAFPLLNVEQNVQVSDTTEAK